MNERHLVSQIGLPAKFLLVCALAAGVTTLGYAAKVDIDTGAGCVGAECAGIDTSGLPTNPGDGTLRLSNVETVGCVELESNKIHKAVDWLQDNMNGMDKQMGDNRLLSWPGNSRANFIEKLGKPLEFHCISEKDKCGGLLGIVYPVVAQKRVNLCTNSIRDYAAQRDTDRLAQYIHVVAHETGHLVRWNGHREGCDYYLRPRFSQSVGLAALHTYLGDDYDAGSYGCFVPDGEPTTWEEIIDNKLQPPPVKISRGG